MRNYLTVQQICDALGKLERRHKVMPNAFGGLSVFDRKKETLICYLDFGRSSPDRGKLFYTKGGENETRG